jgi:uncharacterized damage-inducible protein DinB
MWPMTNDDRIDPPWVADERTMLDSWLDYHRATLARKCAGLTPEQLRTASAPPSDLTLLGLVRHMAEVERGWFRNALARQDAAPLYAAPDDDDADFHHPADADPAVDFAIWRTEITEVRKLAAQHPLDHTFPTSRGRDLSLRWIYVHMIEEYARHNGHADLIRERIDGVTGD